ncbi:uridine-cytidine kinase-like 1 [Mixophyes fleayi]|uniref:uridine-cytidine kinase-like 1 n=1 Tax=Mixophyes fleayi TaxID=3061075 RepID=UPI003F4DB3BC
MPGAVVLGGMEKGDCGDLSSGEMEGEPGRARSHSDSGDDSLDTLLTRLPLTPSLSPRKRTTSQSKTEPPLLRTSKRTIYTAGRPPWYNESGTPFKEAFVIGLCGGSASGKTTVANKIIEALDVPWVVLLSMDCFYKVLSKDQQELAARNEYNFDHPDAFDFDLLVNVLRKLKKGKSVKVPVYDFTTHSRRKEWIMSEKKGTTSRPKCGQGENWLCPFTCFKCQPRLPNGHSKPDATCEAHLGDLRKEEKRGLQISCATAKNKKIGKRTPEESVTGSTNP